MCLGFQTRLFEENGAVFGSSTSDRENVFLSCVLTDKISILWPGVGRSLRCQDHTLNDSKDCEGQNVPRNGPFVCEPSYRSSVCGDACSEYIIKNIDRNTEWSRHGACTGCSNHSTESTSVGPPGTVHCKYFCRYSIEPVTLWLLLTCQEIHL